MSCVRRFAIFIIPILALFVLLAPAAAIRGVSAFQQGRVVSPVLRGKPVGPAVSGKGTPPPKPLTPPKGPGPTAQPKLRSIFGRTVDTNPLTNINASSIVLPLGDDDVVRYDFQNGLVFPYFTTIYTSVFISANGYLTFGQPVFDTTPNLVSFITGPPRIAPFWANLNPAARRFGYAHSDWQRFSIGRMDWRC